MPYFYFDLVFGQQVRDQGGMILENSDAARERADRLAAELAIVRPELQSRGAVRVTDEDQKEIYRVPMGPAAAGRE
jgi:hypothetical protein